MILKYFALQLTSKIV